MDKQFLRKLICEIIEYVGTTALLMLSAGSLASAGSFADSHSTYTQAAIFTSITYVFIGAMHFPQAGITRQTKSKGLFYYVLTGAVVLGAILILGKTANLHNRKTNDYISQAVICIALALIVFEFTYYDRKQPLRGMTLLVRSSVYPWKEKVFKALYYLCRILVVAGALFMTLEKKTIDSSIINVGFVVWMFYKFFWMYCYYYTDDSGGTLAERDGATAGGADTIGERDVEKAVKNIAQRWTGKSDGWSRGAGYVEYDVSVEVSGGNRIEYTINGKIHQVNDNYLSEAYTVFGNKMQAAMRKIVEETERELSKYSLPSSYDINVRNGYLDSY